MPWAVRFVDPGTIPADEVLGNATKVRLQADYSARPEGGMPDIVQDLNRRESMPYVRTL